MIRCRQIEIADLDAIADLLTRGFVYRSRDYWIDGLRHQSVRDVPEGFARFGYMLDCDRTPVGVLLLIYTARDNGAGISIRCNLSSWYVEPGFRNYAPMLSTVAQRHKHVTYVNISPGQWTWRTIEAQGFRAYCGGLFFSYPALSRPAKGMRIEVVQQDARAVDGLSEADVALLTRHAAYGCLSLVCRAADGRSFPFILQTMHPRRIAPRPKQLIYCADVADYVACAGAIGRFLLRRGRFSVALDANGRMKDLVGLYRKTLGRDISKVRSAPGLPICRTLSRDLRAVTLSLHIGGSRGPTAKNAAMKVCFIGLENLPVLAPEYNHHGIGGEQVQQTLLAKALAARGYQVSMVIGDYGQSDAASWHCVTTYKAYRADAGLPVLRFVYPRWTATWAALTRADADVYYTSCAGMLVGLVAMFCRRHGRGLIHRLASDVDADPEKVLIRYTRDKKLYEYGLRRADSVLCQHAGQQRALLENYGLTSVVADMLVDPPDRQLDRDQRDLEILWVSNLYDLKRPELAIELARRMPSRHIHMVGGPQPGYSDLYSKIESAAKSLPNLTFCGRVPYHDVGDLYDRAKIFVNTSDTEGFPNSFLQSWRRGVPVVSFFDPDGLIKREGLGASPQSIDEMACVADHLIADETEWRKASERCRSYMDRMHGDHVVLKPYVAAIEEAVRRRKK